jgi:hypothetical protein
MLGIAFGICLLTGYISHAIQHPPGWFFWPSRPVGLYHITQGLHIATGIAIVPLLGAKIWSVYPKLFRWPPARDLPDGLERLSVVVLVAAAMFQVTTGLHGVVVDRLRRGLERPRFVDRRTPQGSGGRGRRQSGRRGHGGVVAAAQPLSNFHSGAAVCAR